MASSMTSTSTFDLPLFQSIVCQREKIWTFILHKTPGLGTPVRLLSPNTLPSLFPIPSFAHRDITALLYGILFSKAVRSIHGPTPSDAMWWSYGSRGGRDAWRNLGRAGVIAKAVVEFETIQLLAPRHPMIQHQVAGYKQQEQE